MAVVTFCVIGWWWLAIIVLLVTGGVLTFFRDPHRRIPTERNVMVSPADGRVTSIHEVEHFEPFDGPAVCVRIFLSVFNVHVNRSPCHSIVSSMQHGDGSHLSALNPRSAEENEWHLIVLRHPTDESHVAAVRQVAGQVARTIVCGVSQEQVVQRGERIGMIILGSTTELYVPMTSGPRVRVSQGEQVRGGVTVLVSLTRDREGQPRSA